MDKKRQFSLAYLFLETFWVAVALALTRVYFVTPRSSDWLKVLIVAGIIAWGAAIGGVFHRITLGMQIGAGVVLVAMLADMTFLPSLRRLINL
jgi:dolichyl-phosphate-mannose--protein O-mannosyl transferase